jgi:fatty acid desaturase
MLKSLGLLPARADLPALWHRVEGPTWLVAVAVHAGWLALTWFHHALPWWLVLPLGAWLTAWHASLQHEVLHGHPTRRPALNTALALVPVLLWLPYPLYRSRHLRHHATPQLTDPFDDTESFYVDAARWQRLGTGRRLILRVNNTLAGRLLIGPALAVLGFWQEEGARLVRGEPGCARIWLSHAALTAVLLVWVVGVCGIPLWAYVLFYVYPGTALILLRSYYEHRPAADPAQRTAVVEAGPLMTLLYLGNNFHALHHERPGIPWYELPRTYRAERDRVLAENGGFLFAGYGDIVRRFLWREKDSPLHPGPAGRCQQGASSHE